MPAVHLVGFRVDILLLLDRLCVCPRSKPSPFRYTTLAHKIDILGVQHCRVICEEDDPAPICAALSPAYFVWGRDTVALHAACTAHRCTPFLAPSHRHIRLPNSRRVTSLNHVHHCPSRSNNPIAIPLYPSTASCNDNSDGCVEVEEDGTDGDFVLPLAVSKGKVVVPGPL